jgi:3-hydroxyisobutyrate dehydrogenase-like beta-hydroxyacid dehydrogenase
MTIVAFFGLGQMGLPMARNLTDAGFDVRVWNRTPARAREVGGAVAAGTVAEAARGADIAITMLADDTAVAGVGLGDDGLVATLPAGSVHLGMSTISVALAQRLSEAHAAARQDYVAAPVFGRPEAAAARQLWIVPGGPAAALERCGPVFKALGQGTFPMGDAAQATLAKLVGNLMIAATIESLGEALTLSEKAGIEPGRMLDMLTGTLFGSPVVRRYGDLIARTEFEPAGFALALGLKDVGLALDAGTALRVPLPVAALLRERLLTALARGRETYDWSGLASVIRESAGLPPRRG